MRRWLALVLSVSMGSLTVRAEEPAELIVVGPRPMVVLPPPVKRPLNWEPFLLTGAGVVMAGIGAWRLIAAENAYQALRVFTQAPGESADDSVTRARALAQGGKFDTGVGWTLIGLGAAAVGGSIWWLFAEGIEKDPIVFFAPLPGGGAAVLEGRF
jgi:hypothetical protein